MTHTWIKTVDLTSKLQEEQHTHVKLCHWDSAKSIVQKNLRKEKTEFLSKKTERKREGGEGDGTEWRKGTGTYFNVF